MCKGPGVRRRVAWTKDVDTKVSGGGEELVHDECGQFLGPHGPHVCSLYPSSSGKPCKDLKHRE